MSNECLVNIGIEIATVNNGGYRREASLAGVAYLQGREPGLSGIYNIGVPAVSSFHTLP